MTNAEYNYIPEEQIKKIQEKFAAYEDSEGHALSSKEIHSFFKQVLSVCDRKSDYRLIIQGISQLLIEVLKDDACSTVIFLMMVPIREISLFQLCRNIWGSRHKIGFTDIRFAYSRDLSRKILDQPNLFDSKKQQQSVKNFLSKVGYEVMQSIKRWMVSWSGMETVVQANTER